MTKRTFTRDEVCTAAYKFMKDTYPDLKREEPERYFTLLGTLYDFATAIVPIEKDADND